MTRRSLSVALIGHSTNSDNLGVGALTVSEVEILREAARSLGIELTVRVLEWRDIREPYVVGHDIKSTRLSGRDIINPWVYFRRLRQSDLVVDIGGGDSFSDIYGPSRLLKMLLMKYQVHLANRPLVLAPQTIGPFNSRWGRMLALPTLRLCRAVFTRDDLSIESLRAMGYLGVAQAASDVALRLPFETPGRRPASGRVRIGLNVSGLLMNGGYSRTNMFGLKADYPALIRGIIRDFDSREDCELHLVPHVISEVQPLEDDYGASEKLAVEFPSVELAPRFENPSHAKAYIAGMDFFMGARMHSCIAAFSAGVPVIPMAYSRKFRGLFSALGYDRTVDCGDQSAEEIRSLIAEAYADRATLATEVREARSRGLARLDLYTEALRLIMKEAAQ